MSRFRLGMESLEKRWLLNVDFSPLLDIRSVHDDSSSDPSAVTVVGEVGYFSASTVNTGTELWKTDGTKDGTTLFKDIAPGRGSSGPQGLTNVGGTLFFVAIDPVRGHAIWQSDGTPDGTTVVKELISSRPDTFVTAWQLTDVGGTLYFTTGPTHDVSDQTELWKSDGTEDSTILLTTFDEGRIGRSSLTAVGDRLYFVAMDANHGSELWVSDGSQQGTFMVRDIAPGVTDADPASLIDFGGVLIFSAEEAGARELWRSDGTESGTHPISDFDSSELGVARIKPVDEHVYFSLGSQLWRSSGELNGLQFVHDFKGGLFGDFHVVDDVLYLVTDLTRSVWRTNGIEVERLADFGDFLYSSDDDVYIFDLVNGGAEMWQISNNAGSPQYLRWFRSRPWDPANLNGMLLFRANDGTTGSELWRSDGTPEGTAQVRDIAGSNGSSRPSHLTAINGSLYFTAVDDSDARVIYRSDDQRTTPIHAPHELPFGIDNLTAFQDEIFFTASGVHHCDLWKVDQASSQVKLVADFDNGALQANYGLTAIDNALLFLVEIDRNFELWSTDGSSEETQMIASLGREAPWEIEAFRDRAYVAADGQLWVSDGTTDGTYSIPIFDDPPQDELRWLTVVGDAMFFTARSGQQWRLWQSDGTEEGTFPVSNVLFDDSPYHLTEAGGRVYFVAQDASRQRQVWTSDGTQTGTKVVAPVNGSNLTDVGGTLYFSFAEQIWKSDGSTSGTSIVTEMSRGFPESFAGIGSELYFRGPDDQLWRSDGTSRGTMTVPVFDSYAYIREFMAVDERLYVSTYNDDLGGELWVADSISTATWHNVALPTDVDGDGVVAATDAIKVINEIVNRDFSSATDGQLTSRSCGQPFYDVDDNGFVVASDVILIINDIIEGQQLTALRTYGIEAFDRGVQPPVPQPEIRQFPSNSGISKVIDAIFANSLDDEEHSLR